MNKQIRLNLIFHTSGRHDAGWKTFEDPTKLVDDIDHQIEYAKLAESALFDAIFLPDTPGSLGNIFLRPAPAYSDRAIESDRWAVAWMLLDIDETGKVQRVKFLKYPGLDLETIAVKEALKLQFEPAIAMDGKPQRSWIVWPIEWPSYWWLV